jgi:hypothetical protein
MIWLCLDAAAADTVLTERYIEALRRVMSVTRRRGFLNLKKAPVFPRPPSGPDLPP